MKFTLGKFALPLYAVLTFIYLLIPIFYTFVFSFNDSLKTNLIWRGFTFDKWLNVCQREGVCQAFGNSIFIGLISTIFATAVFQLGGSKGNFYHNLGAHHVLPFFCRGNREGKSR